MALWNKLILSGSNAELNRLYVGTSVTASNFTGDGSAITGIVSASYSLSASYAPPQVSVSASYSTTSSYSDTSVTASYFRECKTFGLTIDGGGSDITAGIKGDITIPFDCTIDSWYLSSDQDGNIVIDIWKDIAANFPPTVLDSIAGSEKPTLAGQNYNSDTNLTTWSKSVTGGDVIRFNVDSVSTITRANLTIKAWL